jgi:cytochrome P450
MTATSEPRAYPFSLPDRLNLDPRYARLRADEPLIRVRLPYGEDAWLATRYQDVRTVLGDPRFSRAAAVGRDEPRSRPEPSGSGMLSMDPPEHTRLRKLVAKAFTMRRVEALRPRVQQIADGLLDRMVEHGPPADLVEEFALPLPVTVICELLGVPYEDRNDFRRWSDAVLSTTALTREQVQEYLDNLHEYMAGLVAKRRVDPTEDLLGALVRARDEEDRLTEDELVRLGVGILVAGHETTASQIPNFVYVLLTRSGEWQRLRTEPELVPRAVEELLRYIPLGAAAGFPRYATEDVELGGVLVRAGEPVLAVVASANRDERVFADPDTLDLAREANPHVGFGHGVHHCLGAPLARMELQVALDSLLRCMPELRLAAPEPELRWKTGMLVRGLESFPVSW